jgi:SAM-dependent methyltransferase
MNELASRIKNFWEKTSPRNAHLGESGEAPEMMSRYKKVLKDIRIAGRTFLDFGCGGGLLGKYVLEKGAFKYIGYDVAERSIRIAEANTSSFVNREFILIRHHHWDLFIRQPDIIVCLACIIHFPSREYLDNVLQTFDESNADHIILEIRDTGDGTVFHEKPYQKGTMSVIMACRTNEKYISERLKNYELIDKTDEKAAPTHCQILRYTRRKINDS